MLNRNFQRARRASKFHCVVDDVIKKQLKLNAMAFYAGQLPKEKLHIPKISMILNIFYCLKNTIIQVYRLVSNVFIDFNVLLKPAGQFIQVFGGLLNFLNSVFATTGQVIYLRL